MNPRIRRRPIAILFLLPLLAAPAARAAEITAITLFLCDGSGTVNTAGRWNTGPIDAAWDLYVFAGEATQAALRDPAKLHMWSAADHRVRIPLKPGRNAFAVAFDSTAPPPRLGLNIFFDGDHTKPGISAMADVIREGAPRPGFTANAARVTMGWPITDVPGAGTLAYCAGDVGLWSYAAAAEQVRVVLGEFRVAAPPADGADIVGPHEPKPSGSPDLLAQVVLDVEPHVPEPPQLSLWLETVAGIPVGGASHAADWSKLFEGASRGPFSFNYGDRPSAELLKTWTCQVERAAASAAKVDHAVVYTDPATGLQVRWEAVEYLDFPTVEWVLRFKNTGAADTPILSDIRALDIALKRRPAEEFTLRHWKGTFVRRDDYELLVTALGPGTTQRFAPPGGRPCGHVFPYYNLEAGGEGMLIAVGWPGQWMCEFASDAERGLAVRAGQETTRFVLRPGEEIRTPLMVIQFWKGGDWIDAQNVWRRWMVAHNLPRPGGRLPPLPQFAACSSHQFAEMIHANEANQILFVDRHLEEGLDLDYWWMDAGWYINDWGWPHTGTWEVDRNRFPNGLRAISDHARARGVKTLVWFEPERVARDTWLTKNHPEWIIGGADGGLLDLGDAQARQWLTEHIDKILVDEGIDLYRQDFNMDPLGAWRAKDAPDRQGITENHHVTGYLAYWDELRRRHPDMLIDSCASGGHRNDLETLRRAVPLLRSDYLFDPTGQQGHTYGLAFWMPFFGTGMSYPARYDTYVLRSNMCPHNTGCFDLRDKTLDYALIRNHVAQWRKVAPAYYGDFYPLTPYSLDETDWIAWQFHMPGAGQGMVQAFRRQECLFFGAHLSLRGLEPDAAYRVTDLDAPESPATATGRALMEHGLRVEIDPRPGAALYWYEKE